MPAEGSGRPWFTLRIEGNTFRGEKGNRASRSKTISFEPGYNLVHGNGGGGESVYLSSCLPTRVGYGHGGLLGLLLGLLCLELVSLLLDASYWTIYC